MTSISNLYRMGGYWNCPTCGWANDAESCEGCGLSRVVTHTRMRDQAMFIEEPPQADSASYLAARDYVINLSRDDQTKLYQFMYKAYDHCRIYR